MLSVIPIVTVLIIITYFSVHFILSGGCARGSKNFDSCVLLQLNADKTLSMTLSVFCYPLLGEILSVFSSSSLTSLFNLSLLLSGGSPRNSINFDRCVLLQLNADKMLSMMVFVFCWPLLGEIYTRMYIMICYCCELTLHTFSCDFCALL